jgi:hypothetical protein
VNDPPNGHVEVALVAREPDGSDFPKGTPIPIDVEATDNLGYTQHSRVQVTAWTAPVFATWTVRRIVATSPVPVAVALKDSSSSRITQGGLTVDGKAIPSTAFVPTRKLTLAMPAKVRLSPGVHHLAVNVTLANGHHYVFARAVTSYVRPKIDLTAPASVTRGHRTTFTTTIRAAGVARAGVPVLLQSRAAGAKTWVTRGRATTNAGGQAVMHARPSRPATWRAITALHGLVLSGASRAIDVRIRSRSH